MRQFLKDASIAKSKKQHDERELSKELREIEEAARASLQADRQQVQRGQGYAAYQPGQAPPSMPVAKAPMPALQESDFVPQLPKDDGKPKGQYQVRGQWYIQADVFHDRIVPGHKCQVRVMHWCVADSHGEQGVWFPFLTTLTNLLLCLLLQAVDPVEDEWVDATIMSSRAIPVPNTDIVIRKVFVQLPGNKFEEVNASNVRFPVDSPPLAVSKDGAAGDSGRGEGVPPETSNEAEATPPAEVEEKKPVVIDPTTGLGQWETVRVVDEAEEAKAAKLTEQLEKRREAREKRKAKGKPLDDGDQFAMDAYQVANPWGGAYRGVNLTSGDASSGDEDDTGAAKPSAAPAFDVPPGHVMLDSGRIVPAPPPRRMPPPAPPRMLSHQHAVMSVVKHEPGLAAGSGAGVSAGAGGAGAGPSAVAGASGAGDGGGVRARLDVVKKEQGVVKVESAAATPPIHSRQDPSFAPSASRAAPGIVFKRRNVKKKKGSLRKRARRG